MCGVLQARGAVRTDILSVGRDHPGLACGAEQIPTETLDSKTTVVAFSATVLPGASRIDLDRSDPVLSQPNPDGAGD